MITPEQKSEVKKFNETFKIGDMVFVKMDDGFVRLLTVKKPATVLSHGQPVGWFEELSGCYDLSRVIYEL